MIFLSSPALCGGLSLPQEKTGDGRADQERSQPQWQEQRVSKPPQDLGILALGLRKLFVPVMVWKIG